MRGVKGVERRRRSSRRGKFNSTSSTYKSEKRVREENSSCKLYDVICIKYGQGREKFTLHSSKHVTLLCCLLVSSCDGVSDEKECSWVKEQETRDEGTYIHTQTHRWCLI